MEQSPLMRAVEAAGSQGKLAAAIGTKQQNVWKWLRKGEPPAEFVLRIEKATGISRAELRPDLYPSESAA